LSQEGKKGGWILDHSFAFWLSRVSYYVGITSNCFCSLASQTHNSDQVLTVHSLAQ